MQDYGTFLCALFDEWYRDWKTGQYTSVRLFDDYVHLAMGLPSGTCATSDSCGNYFVVEGDGGIYPCDFYFLLFARRKIEGGTAIPKHSTKICQSKRKKIIGSVGGSRWGTCPAPCGTPG